MEDVWKMCDVFVSELSCLLKFVKRPLPLPPLPCWLGSASQRSEPKDWSGQHGERRERRECLERSEGRHKNVISDVISFLDNICNIFR